MLGRIVVIGLRDRLEVKLLRVGEGDESPGENRLQMRGEAVGEEEAEADAEELPRGIDTKRGSVQLGRLCGKSMDIEA